MKAGAARSPPLAQEKIFSPKPSTWPVKEPSQASISNLQTFAPLTLPVSPVTIGQSMPALQERAILRVRAELMPNVTKLLRPRILAFRRCTLRGGFSLWK
jgi:hypothetical protein